MKKLLKVKPVQVPWSIDCSYDIANLVWDNATDNEELKIRISTYPNTNTKKEVLSKLSLEYGGEDKVPDSKVFGAARQIVELEFIGCSLFVKHSHIYGYEFFDYEVIYPEIIKDHNEQWNRTNICPNPSFYEVVDQDLLKMLGFKLDTNRKHWFLTTQSEHINIVANDFTWSYVTRQSLNKPIL